MGRNTFRYSEDIHAEQLPDWDVIAACYDRAVSIDGLWKSHIMTQGMLSWMITIGRHCVGSACTKPLSCEKPASSGTFEKELIILLANLLEVT